MKRFPRALAGAVRQNMDSIKEELARRQQSEALFQKAEKVVVKARAARRAVHWVRRPSPCIRPITY